MLWLDICFSVSFFSFCSCFLGHRIFFLIKYIFFLGIVNSFYFYFSVVSPFLCDNVSCVVVYVACIL